MFLTPYVTINKYVLYFEEAALYFVCIIFINGHVGQGVTFPAMHVLLSKWAPPAERSVLSTLVYAGTALGTVISMFMAGVLTDNLGKKHAIREYFLKKLRFLYQCHPINRRLVLSFTQKHISTLLC